jgi:hypothetical protein
VGNYELDVLLHDPRLGSQLEAQYRRDMAQSAEVLLDPRRRGRTLERVLPESAEHFAPSLLPRRRRFRNTRRQTGLAVRSLASAAQRSVFGPVALGLSALALLFLVLPRTMGIVVAALCAWLAIGAAVQAFRSRIEL